MKFTTSIISGLALCVVNVAAQDFGSLPTCAQGCATNAIPASCGLNVSCICSASSFITSVSCCVATACDAADQQTTLQFAEQLCAGVGVTSLPSAAGCSATGAATSAASAGTSTTVGAASTAVTSAKTSASAVSSAASSVATSAKTSATGTASSSAASTSHSGAATPMAKSNGVAAAGAGAAALLAAIFV